MNPRIPQKINSIEKKERLAETCYYLACQIPYEEITASIICDSAKVSVGTFYAYFKDKKDIMIYSILKYSKPILFPIYNNIGLLKFKKNTIEKTISKMINISLDTQTMTKQAYKNILSIIYKNNDFFNIYTTLLSEELSHIYNKCILNSFNDTNNDLKETINLTLNLIKNYTHDKIIAPSEYINYNIQKENLEKFLYSLWKKHIL